MMMMMRPHGKVKVMRGMALRSVHCRDGFETGELRLKKRMFSPGLVITRQAPTKCGRSKLVSAEVHSITIE